MKSFLLIAFFSVTICSYAQDEQKEINAQVWKPFIAAFNNHETANFMALHSKEVIRSPRDSKKIWGWDEYQQRQQESDDQAELSGRKTNIELRFIERIANSTRAIDVGIYKTTITNDKGSKSGYGKFLVVLRRENGIWKILVDTDSSEGRLIGEKDFLAAQPME